MSDLLFLGKDALKLNDPKNGGLIEDISITSRTEDNKVIMTIGANLRLDKLIVDPSKIFLIKDVSDEPTNLP